MRDARPRHAHLYAVYDRPTDYPGQVVVRRWTVTRTATGVDLVPDRDPHAVVATVDAARATLPSGLTTLPRDAAEDPVIVETWW